MGKWLRWWVGCTVVVMVAACGSADDGDDDDDNHTPADDDSSPIDDDDSYPDDDDNDNNDNNNDDNDTSPGPDRWCLDIADAPPEPGWQWTAHTVIEISPFRPNAAEANVTLSEDAVWVLATIKDEIGYYTNHYLGRLAGGEWRQWEVLPGEPYPDALVLDVNVDSSGRPWSVLYDYDRTVLPTVWGMVRWEDGEVVEILPAFDGGLQGFNELYPMLANGNFAYMYRYGSLHVVEQYPEGGYVAWAGEIISSYFVPGPDSLLHSLRVSPWKLVFYEYGSAAEGFHRRIVGRAPFEWIGHVASTAPGVTDDGTFYFTGALSDNNFWLGRYDGEEVTFERWLPDGYDIFGIYPYYGAGVFQHDKPFFLLSRMDYGEPYTTCFLYRDAEGTHAEIVGLERGGYIYDWASAKDGRIAAVYQLATDTSTGVELRFRQPIHVGGEK